MSSFNQPAERTVPWFGLGLASLFFLALGLRLWGLDRFNTLVFDEIYYAKFAHNYLSQTPFFDGHPPLSKYIIALGMWLGSQMPFGQEKMNGLAGGLYAPWTYRWLNALTGSFIPLVVAGILFQLTHRQRLAFLAGLFVVLDGLFLVESRYALNNVYLVLFGLLGWWFLLLALNSGRSLHRVEFLLLSGMSFGAAIAIKWNGLWFLLGAWGIWVCAQLIRRFQIAPWHPVEPVPARINQEDPRRTGPSSPLQRLSRVTVWQTGLYLGVLPLLTYILTWIPHLKLNFKSGFWTDFWSLQVEILQYHERVGNGPNIHPYCSNWYSWLLMWRPVAYFYKVTGQGDPLPTEVTMPPPSGEKVIYDVHAMGTPFLWWFATIAIVLILLTLAGLLIQQIATRFARKPDLTKLAAANQRLGLNLMECWLLLFIGINYLANLLPWVRVSRCLFLYHYMGSYVFSIMGLAWLVDRWLSSTQPYLRRAGVLTILLVGLGFLFWLPIYLGLPLSPQGFQLRMWLRSWV